MKNPVVKFCSKECAYKCRNDKQSKESRDKAKESFYKTINSRSEERKQEISQTRRDIELKKLEERLGKEKYKQYNDPDFLKTFIDENGFDIEGCCGYFGVQVDCINRKKREYGISTKNYKKSKLNKPNVMQRELLKRLGGEKYKQYNDPEFFKTFIKDDLFLRDECAEYFGVQVDCINRKKREYGIEAPNKHRQKKTPEEQRLINIKREQTFVKRYGVTNPMKHKEFKQKNYDNNVINHGGIHNLFLMNANNVSKAEEQLYLYLKEKYSDLKFIWNNDINREIFINPENKNNLECDILVFKGNSLIAGIEYNGLYWHSNFFPITQERDQIKSEQAKWIPGFKLFQVQEYHEESFLACFEEFLRINSIV